MSLSLTYKSISPDKKVTPKTQSKILTILIAAVWLINGLFCKVLALVPRHEQIVGRILGDEFASPITMLIGLAEIFLAFWFISSYQSRFNAILQITLVITMNIIEAIFASDLLLWGRANFIFALLFSGLVYYYEFILNKKGNL